MDSLFDSLLNVNASQSFGHIAIIAALIFIIVLSIRFLKKKNHRRFQLGIYLLVLLTLLTVMKEPILGWFPEKWVDFRDTVSKLISTLWWISLAFVITSGLERYLDFKVKHRNNKQGVPKLMTQFYRGAIYLITVMVIMNYVYGKPITTLAATSGVLVFILGFSAQTTLGELFSGIALNMESPFKKGDLVEIAGDFGEIYDIYWRSVQLKTFSGNLVYLPNSKVVGSKIINFDRPNSNTRVDLRFKVDFRVPPDKVKILAKQAAEECRSIVVSYEPFVMVCEMKDVGIEYELRFFIDTVDNRLSAKAEVYSALWHSFQRNSVPFAYNRRDLQEFSEGDSLAVLKKPKINLKKLIKESDLFRDLKMAEITILSKKMNAYHFGPPERIIKQGAMDSSLFLIASGKVEVLIKQADGSDLTVANLEDGATVGTMSLLTGQPRSATVRAQTEVIAYELQKEHLKPLLDENPDLVEKIAQEIVIQQQANKEKSLNYTQDRKRVHDLSQTESLITTLSQRIRHFFAQEAASKKKKSVIFPHKELES